VLCATRCARGLQLLVRNGARSEAARTVRTEAVGRPGCTGSTASVPKLDAACATSRSAACAPRFTALRVLSGASLSLLSLNSVARFTMIRCEPTLGIFDEQTVRSMRTTAVQASAEAITKAYHVLAHLFASLLFAFRAVFRVVRLSALSVPVMWAYQFSTSQEFYVAIRDACFAAGPTFVKLAQWASTRPDLFPAELCQILAMTHSRVPCVSWENINRVLQRELPGGHFYEKNLNLTVERVPLAAGAIAQVHRATLQSPGGPHSEPQEVIIKVIRAGVRELIELDLGLLGNAAAIIRFVAPSLAESWAINDAVGSFDTMMRRQLDLRVEAHNLIKFAKQFENERSWIQFPEPVSVVGASHRSTDELPALPAWLVTRDVLIESYLQGATLSDLTTAAPESQLSKDFTPALRHKLARNGCHALFTMLFKHGFVHTDLHPGNALYNVAKRDGEPVLGLLDCGSAVQLSDRQRRDFTDLFRAIIKRDGAKAAQLMIERSAYPERVIERDVFIQQIDALVTEVLGQISLGSGVRLANVGAGAVLGRLLDLSRIHKVSLDGGFVAVAVAVMLLDGVGRSLDPQLDLLQIATPYVVRSVARGF